jgi:hypothetical protein
MRLVMKRTLGLLLAIFLAGSIPSIGADAAATVTEAVNDVSHGNSQTTDTTPAKAGTVIQDGEYLKTGVKSRAELALANQSITRLGANTVFNYSVATNEVDLQAGTILFSKPKDGKEMTIKTASVTAAIVGTTGFASLQGSALLFGLIEGHARLMVGGTDYNVTAGQILRMTGDGKPQIFFYNLPLFLKTSPLITKYHSSLPNQTYINAEVDKYNDFAARGFIGPPTVAFPLSDINGFVPVLPVTASDSAANSLKTFNTSPPPPPPAVSNGPPPPPP